MFTMQMEGVKFNKFVNEFIKGSSVDVDLAMKKFAFDLLNRIIKKNPVDTGRSRAGWFVAFEKLGGSSAGFGAGKGRGTSTKKSSVASYGKRGAIAEGRRLGSIKLKLGQFVSNKYIEIVNGVSYIVHLEYGYSRQAPYGMVRVSMREMRKGTLPKDMGRRMQIRWNRQMTGAGGYASGQFGLL